MLGILLVRLEERAFKFLLFDSKFCVLSTLYCFPEWCWSATVIAFMIYSWWFSIITFLSWHMLRSVFLCKLLISDRCWQDSRGPPRLREELSRTAAAAAKSLQSCPTVWPHRRQPTRLPRPWDSPGKNTGVGCHCLLLRAAGLVDKRGVSCWCLTQQKHGWIWADRMLSREFVMPG